MQLLEKHTGLGKMLLLMAIVMVSSQCTFRRPTTQTVAPAGPNDSTAKVDKNFFVGKDKSGRQKRFLFGVAPEREIGRVAEYLNTHGVPEFEHANIEFRITEKFLVGLKVNPSYPDDPTRWAELIKIPIDAHYYSELRKDPTGRDSNDLIENSDRSHWSARPYVKLNLSSLKILFRSAFPSWSERAFMALEGANSVSDIEFVQQEGFLGFSIRSDGGGTAVNQAVYRVNLKSFEHNPNFKKTPFNEQNYKYMNVLHVMGHKTETQDQVLYAAHWDLSKQHTVVLTGFPKEYERLGIATVEAWNKAFQDIKAVAPGARPFVPVVKELKHPFDLRYTVMHWVQDIRISQTSPLGVGVTTADVANGEIMWGKVTAYGGYLENYVKNHTPTGATSKSTGLVRFFDGLFDSLGLSKVISAPPDLINQTSAVRQQLNMLVTEDLLKAQAQRLTQAMNSSESTDSAPADASGAVKPKVEITPEHMRILYAGMNESLSTSLGDTAAGVPLGQLTQQFGLDRLMQRISQASDQEDPMVKHLRTLSGKDQFDYMARHTTRTDCSDRTFEDVGPTLTAALNGVDRRADLQFVLDSMIYELLLHEMGHMIGLGHQFKENIVPHKDKVPTEIYNALAKDATAERGYSNATSVMGYRSPRVEIAHYELKAKEGVTDPVKTFSPGEQDKLVLRYLYKQQFTTINKQVKDDFVYFAVPKNGIIPTRALYKNTTYQTSYFPQCNDGQASYGLDPYCNRFDRGPDAKAIVTSYFDDLKDTMIQRLIAFSDSRDTDAGTAEFHLWRKSLSTFSRVRIFYDYMRAKMESEIPAENRRILQTEDALYEFSNACTVGSKNENVAEWLSEIFTKNPHLKELCEVNQLALREFSKILSLSVSDHSKIDFENYFFPAGITGGDVDYDYSRIAGTWRELGAFPMKLAALYAMQSATPFVSFGSWLFPIMNYDSPDRRYAYVSLYPREYTETQTAVVKNNLRFANVHMGEVTRIGKAVLYMGMLPQYIGRHNDSSRLPPQFVQRLRTQANFAMSYVAVLLKKDKDPNDEYIARKFSPTIFDLNTGKESNATEAFLLPEGEVMVRAENTFLVPTTKFQFIDDEIGFVFAIRLTFYEDEEDVLNTVSPKTALKDLHDQTVSACLKGRDNDQNGLSMFFTPNSEDFKGFLMPPKISVDKEKQRQFRESIRLAYSDYYNNKTAEGKPRFTAAPTPSTCQDAVQGLRMVVSAAALLNGYWLTYTSDYIQN